MNIFSSVASTIFWGLLFLSILVVVHEFGHFFAARIVGCRVTEFFVGLPCRFKIARRSKKLGTEFGVTPLLIGGYNQVCGMESVNDEHAKRVFAYVLRHGVVSVDDVMRECDMTEKDAFNVLTILVEWAAIEYGRDEQNDEKSKRASESRIFQTVDRDDAFLTRYDRGNTLASGKTVAYPAGLPQPCDDADACYAAERAHVYRGKGFFARMFVLVMGSCVNVLVGIVLLISVLMFQGERIPSGSNVIGEVAAQSCAAKAGLQDGDMLVSIDGRDTPSWRELVAQLTVVMKKGAPFAVAYERGGVRGEVTARPEGALEFGVHNESKHVFFGFGDAVRATSSYVATLVRTYGKLFDPAHIGEILNQSSSVVGISVAASKTAALGFFFLAKLAAVVSLSLGFMNLLPLLPLDGGRIVIETVQLIFRREIPAKVLSGLTLAGGVLLLVATFIVMRADIFRLMFG